MRILVAGSAGQIARSLANSVVTGAVLKTFGRPSIDFERPETVEIAVRSFAPDLIINAAAYTAVDKAESEPEVAMRINADGPAALAALSAERRVPIIHLSTDYVFAGDKTAPYVETDLVGPIGAYGRSKLEGELRVAASNPKHLILRTAWVHAPFGSNFVRTMLRLAETKAEINVVSDQQGAPTFAPDIAQGLLEIVERLGGGHTMKWGVYHMTSSGACTWADFAEYVFACSQKHGGPTATVNRISTADYPTPARRPKNSRLDCTRLHSDYGVVLPNWRSGVDRCVAELLKQRRAA